MMNLSMKFPVKTLFQIIAFSVVTFFTFPTHGADWSAAQKEVWKMQETVWNLWKKGDNEGRLSFYHKDCTLWYYGSSFPTDIGGIRGRVRSYPDMITFEQLEPQEVKVFNNFAIVQYSINYAIVGKDYNERIMTTWMKQNGNWQIIGSMHAQQPGKYSE